MECNGWGGGKIGGVRRGLGGEELVIACVDNFLAKFDCEEGFGDTEQELEGHAHNGKGFFWVLVLPLCIDGKDPGEGVIEESNGWSWVS